MQNYVLCIYNIYVSLFFNIIILLFLHIWLIFMYPKFFKVLINKFWLVDIFNVYMACGCYIMFILIIKPRITFLLFFILGYCILYWWVTWWICVVFVKFLRTVQFFLALICMAVDFLYINRNIWIDAFNYWLSWLRNNMCFIF